ncbi:ribonuclease H-like protein [Pluteus cervinus]|uniref:Ribonuclease H-like protein n=1 Tax=Pluteus cervinus TaxID=181527 RepID=A0ACD3AQ42_9AGAR|nr:ribonuclease H-like protein [Pluteus cervinus]
MPRGSPDTSLDSVVEVLGPFPVEKQKQTADRKEKKPDTKLMPYPLSSKASNARVGSSNPRPLTRYQTYPQTEPSNSILGPTSEVGTTSSANSGSAKRLARSKSEPMGHLPRYTYKDYTPRACVVHTNHEDEVDDLVSALAPGPVAFDMEWRYFLRKGLPQKTNRVAVVQLADTKGMILVIQVYHMKRFPRNLQTIIESPHIPKLGVNILGDGRKLFQDYGIVAKNLVELGGVVAQADIVPGTCQDTSQQNNEAGVQPKANPLIGGPFGRKMVSLAKLVERYCGKTLEKGTERSSNWETVPLTNAQIFYAACDVHSSVMIYQRLLKLAKENHVTLSPRDYTSDIIPSNYFPSPSPPQVSRETSRGAQESKPRPQYHRAYRCWHDHKMSLEMMCKELVVVGDSLKPSTVIGYVIGALQDDITLPFNFDALRELVQMEISSWDRHRDWMMQKWAEAEQRSEKVAGT